MTEFSVSLVVSKQFDETAQSLHWIKFVASPSTVHWFSAGPAFSSRLTYMRMYCIVHCTRLLWSQCIQMCVLDPSVYKCVSATYTEALHGLHGAWILSRPRFFPSTLNSARICSKPSVHNANRSTVMYPVSNPCTVKSTQVFTLYQVAKYPGIHRVRTGVFRASSPGVGSSKTPSLPPPFVTKHNGLPQWLIYAHSFSPSSSLHSPGNVWAQP